MKSYFVQYIVLNIKSQFLDSYFANLEKIIMRQGNVDIKHSFIENGKVYINTYVKAEDEHRAGRANLNAVTGFAVEALNYELGDEDEALKVEIGKTEVVS